jgi:hypothetical protein
MHLPLSLLGPALLALTWRNRAPGCELFCNQTRAEVFTFSAVFWTPVMLAAGVVMSSMVNVLVHRRMRFAAWSEIGVACVVTYTVLSSAFVLLADPFHLFGQDNVADASGAISGVVSALFAWISTT